MALNPQVEMMLVALAGMVTPDPATATPEQMRAANDTPLAAASGIAMARVEEIDIALQGRTLNARLYIPCEVAACPALTVFYHGGGWVVGTLDTHDSLARHLASASGAAVLSVAYRLAPEHPFPAPLEDCYEALCWAAANADRLGVDAGRLAVAGDSAGGNLAAAVAILVRDRGGPALRHQALLYPATDCDYGRPSYVENSNGRYFLTIPLMQWFWGHYLGTVPAEEAGLACIQQFPDLSALPAATVVTAQYDPLRDEGMAYAGRLDDAGVPVVAEVAPGMIHGFLSMTEAIPDAVPWIDMVGQRLRIAFGDAPPSA